MNQLFQFPRSKYLQLPFFKKNSFLNLLIQHINKSCVPIVNACLDVSMFFTPSAATALTTSHQYHGPGSLKLPVTLHGFFLHILKSVLNTARLSETPILPCSEVSVSLYYARKTAQVTGMASGLTPTVFQLPSLLLFKQNAYMPH